MKAGGGVTVAPLNSCEVGIISSLLWMRKPKLQEVKRHAQGWRADQDQSQNSKPGGKFSLLHLVAMSRKVQQTLVGSRAERIT